jgi:5-formyltetrahydrofolate cyclo-ligase
MSAESPTSPPDAKRALRKKLIALRARLSPEERAERSRRVAERLEAVAAFRAAEVVALYAPLPTEVDATEIARRALARGAAVVFPRAIPGERRLAFARCDLSGLVPGPFGVAEPPAGAPEEDPGKITCVVVPGIAFSEDGHRLGRGGGHYDATLAAMPGAARVGVAFDLQIVATLPREPHDAALDAVVSDARTLRFSRDSR